MKFLESLYSNENFGIYLFAIIAFLVVLFFIILFFGKKEESKPKVDKIEEKTNENKEEMEEQRKIEEPISISPAITEPVDLSLNAPVLEEKNEVLPGFNETTVPTPLDIKPLEIEEPKLEEKEEIRPVKPEFNFPNMVLNSNLFDEEKPAPLKEELKEDPADTSDILKKEFDFDALADAISKELDTINKNSHSKLENNIEKTMEVTDIKKEPIAPVIEEKPFAFPVFDTVKPDKIPSELIVERPENEIPVEPIKREKPVMPTVFSSVYVNRDNENNEQKIEEPKPAKPEFELPKVIDLPKKRKEEVKPENDGFSLDNILNNVSNETYKINK